MENTGFETYKLYTALKSHFNEDNYDYIKYNGKTRANKDTYVTHKGKYSFMKLAKKYNIDEIKEFLVANFLHDNTIYFHDLPYTESEKIYKEYRKITQSLTYVFKEDINHLFERVSDINDIFKVVDGNYPVLLNEYLSGNIKIQTLVILNTFFNFMIIWNKKITDDIVYPAVYKKVVKYTPFLYYEEETFKDIMKNLVKKWTNK